MAPPIVTFSANDWEWVSVGWSLGWLWAAEGRLLAALTHDKAPRAGGALGQWWI